ncbi:hypothetical protein ACET3X_008932 [Alternaria dauci]|uniref:Uncharacterized protein n=1 Tax=Alternaria dauci TaxID=48095 RepID=A0ABR3U8V2_9PLEO
MASPKTPAVSRSRPWIDNPDIPREVRRSFEFNYLKLCENCNRLNSHSERIRENLSTIQTIESQVKAQGEQLIVSEQLMRAMKKETEEDMKRLKSSLEAEKVRNDRLETLLTQSYIAPSDVIVELQQRVYALTNQATGQKTISIAKMQNINRRLEELTLLIQRSERRSNSDSQKITDLEMKMEHRFETVVINARKELRHDRNDWVKSLENLRNETTEKITKATNDITAAHDVIQSNMNEHTERLNKTVEALRSVNQQVKIFARDADGTAIETRQATTSMLERLEAVEIACNAFQTDAEIKERLTELERSRDEISHAQSTLTNSLTELVTREEFLVAADEARANMNAEIHRGKEAVKRSLERKIIKLEERCVDHWRGTGTSFQNMVQQQLSPVSEA